MMRCSVWRVASTCVDEEDSPPPQSASPGAGSPAAGRGTAAVRRTWWSTDWLRGSPVNRNYSNLSNLCLEQPSIAANWPVQTWDLDSIVKSGQLHSLHPAPQPCHVDPGRRKKTKKQNIHNRSRRETRRGFREERLELLHLKTDWGRRKRGRRREGLLCVPLNQQTSN